MRTKSLGFALLFATIALRGAANADDSFRTLTGLESSASSVAITPDGQNVAAGIAGTVKVWRISDGALLSTLGQIGTEPVYGVAVTSDGGRVVAGDNGKRIRVWQLSDGALLRTIATGVIPMALALTPDGEAVVAGCDDYKIRVWRLSDGQLIRTFVEQHTSVVKGVAVTPDGQTVVSGSLDETIKVWRLSDGARLRTIVAGGPVWNIAATPDGQNIVGSAGSLYNWIKVWSISDGSLLRTLTGHTGGVSGVAITQDGQEIVSASYDNTVRVWRFSDGQLLRTLTGHTKEVFSVAVHADARTIVSGSLDLTIKAWALQSWVAGTITTTTWTAANSPYRVTGTVTVPAGNTLTIEPGVDVLFDADVQFIVAGQLIANGTAQDSIRFLKGTATEWGGLRFVPGDTLSSWISYARLSGANANGGTGDDDFGGAVYVTGYGTRAALARSVISGNRAVAQGAGVWVGNLGSVTLVQCVLRDNVVTSAGGGGGFMANGGSLTLDRCTVVGNDAQTVASVGRVANNAYATLINCVAWGNTGSPFLWDETGGFDVSFSDVEGGYPGEGNINADPLFVNTATGDYNLLAGSPCIDVGDPTSPMDPDGSRADMGAFFFDKRVDQYHVGGEIADGMTWSGGPYHVVGMVTVPEGATLNIAEGTDVLFDADVPFVVEGSLQALGESGEGNGIRFVPGVAPEWGGLMFMGIGGPGGRTASPALERPAGVSGEGSSTIQYAEISGGDADDLSETFGPMGMMGGGVSVFGTSVDIANSRIHNNQAMFGGGLAALEGGIMLDSCVVENNVANAGLGGGFIAVYGGFMANDTQFRNNTAVGTSDFFVEVGGGGGYAEESYAVFERCRFTGNTSAGNGGGVMLANDPVYGPPMEFKHCLFAGNTSAAGGGAYATVPMQGDKPAIRLPDSLRVGLAARPAAAARAQQEPGTAFVNCTFTENTATGAESGGGALIGGKPAGTSDLLPMIYGGGLCSETSIPVTSSILWGNTPDQIAMGGLGIPANKPAPYPPVAIVTFSDVQMEEGMVWEGTGNINADPLFVEVETGDYHLTAYSPCVNTGDPAGAPDPNGTRADMGAFPLEFKTGDVTMDGNITGQDASKVLQFSVKLIPSIPFALADVTNNGRATALDAAMILFKWLRLSLGQDFTFPLDEGYYNNAKLAIPANPRTLTWERSSSAWELRADNPEGLMAGEFAFNVGSDVALSAEAGEYYAANRDGEVIRVAFARTDFTSPVLVRLVDDGRLLAPPSIASMELNDGATPILRVVRPVEFALEQNTPNPFNPTTTIRFGLPAEGQVQLVVYDITGRVVRTLVDNQMEAGVHAVTWDGRDAVGRDVASGTYIYRLVAPNGVLVKRMVMVK